MEGEAVSSLIGVAKPMTLAMPRILAALLVFPLLPASVFPLSIRNALAVAMALPLYPLMRASLPEAPAEAIGWMFFLFKEAAIGGVIGWFYACVIWAFQIIGDLLDSQSGLSFAAAFDPLSGGQAAVFSQLLRNFAVVAFLLAGGLGLMLGVLYDSFTVWPVGQALPRSPKELFHDMLGASVGMFEFGLSLALPVVFLLFICEFSLALVSRSIPQMNVFSLSMPIKMLAGMIGLMLILGYYLDRLNRYLPGLWTLF